MITFFDSNCMLGRRMAIREGSPENTNDVLKIMGKVGIEKALVYHSIARENNPKLGNSLLSEVIGDNKRFIKQWIVMPNCLDEFIDTDDLLSSMEVEDVTSIRLLPRTHNYLLMPFSIGELINTLSLHKIPIFIELSEVSWNDLYQLCLTYPDARFVLCEPGYRCMRQLVPFLSRFKNIWIETSNFVSHNGIKQICQKYGAERLIFGSGMPISSSAAAVSLIRYSEITSEEKEKIAYKNLEFLLNEVSL